MKALCAAALAASLVVGFAHKSTAQNPGDQVSGTIFDLQLGYDPPRMKVRLDSGRTATVYMDGSTRISMSGRRNAAMPDLRDGMAVSFEWPDNRDDVIRSLRVEENRSNGHSSGGNRSGGNDDDWSSSSSNEELKVRLLAMNPRQGAFEADVAGRRRRFQAEDANMMRNFQEGDLAIITVKNRNGRSVVTNIRSAGYTGRVVDVDSRHGEVVIEVDGRERTYTVDRTHLLDEIRRGDRIRFEFEDRSNGRKVITAIY